MFEHLFITIRFKRGFEISYESIYIRYFRIQMDLDFVVALDLSYQFRQFLLDILTPPGFMQQPGLAAKIFVLFDQIAMIALVR